ncbi:hypothetical protein SAMN04515665_1212 [Blastococcus sp. DSM 46786]|nr:hypothetical protein SAMN04515665_1212 [Blastococcus sp. DSM 46786]
MDGERPWLAALKVNLAVALCDRKAPLRYRSGELLVPR